MIGCRDGWRAAAVARLASWPSPDDIVAASRRLRDNGCGVRGAMIGRLEKCFTDNGGDAAAIAAACRCSAESLTVSPPASANDFANKFLDGAYFPQLDAALLALEEGRTGTAHGGGATGTAHGGGATGKANGTGARGRRAQRLC